MRRGVTWALVVLAVALAVTAWGLFFRARPELQEAALRLCFGTAAPSCATRLVGDVHDPAGHPLAGARILAWRTGDCSCQATTTDRTGQFELCVWPGRFWIDAVADGTTRVREGIDVAKTPRRSIELAPQSLILGRVTDAASGRPLPGAEVTALQTTLGPVTVTADAHGVFRFDHLSDTFIQVHVDAEGHAQGIHNVQRTPAWIEARLERGGDEGRRPDESPPGSISGRVVHNGAPAPGVMVSLEGTNPTRVVSDAGGAFHAPGLPPGMYQVRAISESLGTASPIQVFTLGAGEARDLDLDLVMGAAVSGHVVNAIGAPMPRAQVELDCRGERATDESGWDGRFRIPYLEGRGPCEVRVSAPPGLAVVYQAARPTTLALDGPGARVDGVELVVTVKRASISGRVLDEDGHPVAGVAVHWMQGCEGGETTTAADGSFVLRSWQRLPVALSVGGPLVFRAAGSFEVGRDDVVLRTVATTRIEGSLVGFPARPTIVAVRDPNDAFVSAKEGAFTIDDVPLGAVTILARAGSALDLQTIAVRSLATAHVTLRARPTVRVPGRVVDEAGMPVAGTTCVSTPGALHLATASQSLAVAADGRFAIDLPAGLALRIGCSALEPYR
jgi:protocatechuate 3,4-dioxygenase beta subunit